MFNFETLRAIILTPKSFNSFSSYMILWFQLQFIKKGFLSNFGGGSFLWLYSNCSDIKIKTIVINYLSNLNKKFLKLKFMLESSHNRCKLSMWLFLTNSKNNFCWDCKFSENFLLLIFYFQKGLEHLCSVIKRFSTHMFGYKTNWFTYALL